MGLIQMSFMGGIFILAVMALRALLLDRLPKKTFYMLWLAVLIRLLAPFSLVSPASVYTLAQGSEITMERIWDGSGLSALFAGIKEPDWWSGGKNDAAARYTEENTSAADGNTLPGAGGDGRISPGVVTEDARVPASGPLARTVLWAVGVCLGVGFFTCMYIRCRREFAMSLPVEHETARKWQENHPSRRNIAIRQSDRVGSPLSYGIRRPVILMPKNTDWTDRSRLFYVWEHEYVHIRRLDAAVKLFMAAALCLHWFNPLVWVMYVFFNRDMELSCDEAVIRHFGREARAAYAMTLIAMAEKQSGPGLLYSSFSKNVMEGRIRSIMKIRKKSILATFAAVVLTGTVCLAFATSPATGKAGTREDINDAVQADPVTGIDDMAEEVPQDDETAVEVTAWERMEKAVGYDREAILARMAEIDNTLEQMNADESDYTETLSEEKTALEGMLDEVDRQDFFEKEYGAYGVSYRLPECRLYKDGKMVMSFYDEKGSLWWDDEGTVAVEVIRDGAGKILRLSEADAGDGSRQGHVISGGGGSGEANADSSGIGGVEDAEGLVLEGSGGSGTADADGSVSDGMENAQQTATESARDMHAWVLDLVYNIAHSERFSEYEECGLTYDEASGYLMYVGEKVGRFKDEWEPGAYTLYSDPTGEVAIEICRGPDGKITGIISDSLDAFPSQELAEGADTSGRRQ